MNLSVKKSQEKLTINIAGCTDRSSVAIICVVIPIDYVLTARVIEDAVIAYPL